MVIKWQSSVPGIKTPGVHWDTTGERIFGSQCASSVHTVVCQWSSRDVPVCYNYANYHWIATGTPLE